MKLTRIELPGFGCLRDFRTELAPGLNVFYGMNEAGKSTLQQAVRALLYGFYDADRARSDESAQHERFRPWEGGVYRGSLEYETGDGRRFEVRRDFTTTDVSTQLIDLFTGEDVSPQFGRSRHGNVPFARRQLGMSRAVFQSCAFISQGEVFHVAENGPREIADAIAALADTAGRDVSATKAIERLKTALAQIGSDRARTAQLPRAREELSAADAELAAIDAARSALSDRAAKLDGLQDDLNGIVRELERVGLEFARARAYELSGRLHKLDEAEDLMQAADETKREFAAFVQFPAELRDDVLSAKVRWERATESLTSARQASAEAEEAISRDERLEFQALRVAVGDFNGEQISSLEAVAYATERHWLKRAARAVAAAIARAGRAVWRFVRRRPSAPEPAPTTGPAGLSRDEALTLLEKHRRYLTMAPAIDRLGELRRRLDRDEAEVEALRHRLISLLESAGVSSHEDMEEAVGTFLERCKSRARYEKAVSAADEAAKRTELLLNGSTRDRLQAERRECESVAGGSPDERITARKGASSRDLALERQDLRTRRGELELAVERLREEVRLTMAQRRSLAEVEEEAAVARARVGELERAREAMRTAVDAIEEAMISVYRDFAPAVNTFLSEGIERVTGGRYTRAHVDPKTLGISLLVPETGLVVKDPPVSHGTRTLAYVLMRIGLAQHMSSVGEPVPLVLDDPFVDVDAERLPRVLDYLAELSDRIQVLIFTKDPEIVQWLESRTIDGRHRVHALGPGVPVTA